MDFRHGECNTVVEAAFQASPSKIHPEMFSGFQASTFHSEGHSNEGKIDCCPGSH